MTVAFAGAILIVSRSDAFRDIIAGMVTAAGLKAVFPMGVEPATLTVTRTQPRLVICDCANAVDNIQRFLIEVSARELPLLLCDPLDVPALDRELVSAKGVACFTLPISSEAFSAAVARLLDPAPGEVDRFTVSAGGLTVDGGVCARPLPIFPQTTGVYQAVEATPRLAGDIRIVR